MIDRTAVTGYFTRVGSGVTNGVDPSAGEPAGTIHFFGHAFSRNRDQLSVSAHGGARRIARAL